jgi:outer membrane protein assembly factor BamB
MDRRILLLSFLLILISFPLLAADWSQFRGPHRDGASDDAKTPTTWDESTNVLWKQKLPGHGSSSPIVVDGKVFLTCYSGYGFEERNPGDQSALVRHVLAFDLNSGKSAWEFPAPAKLPEEDFRGFQALHGYASSTPATDGKTLYVFFGKSGVGAMTLDGKPKWSQSVGEGKHGWGSATSPVLYKNLVIVNASVESGALVALDKTTGKQVWSSKGVRSAWNSPVLVTPESGKTEVVISSQSEILAYDAESGQSAWRCSGVKDYVCPTVLVHGDVVYAIGARSGMGVAVKAGGKGNVSPLWEMGKGSNVSSPVFHKDHLYWAHEGRGVVYCANAKTGEIVYEERLQPSPDRIYASAVLAGDKIYYVSRNKGVYVVAADPQFKLLAHNEPLDKSVFNASPAVVDGKLLLRSNEYLYCLGK